MHYAKIAEHACCMERGKLSCVGDDECGATLDEENAGGTGFCAAFEGVQGWKCVLGNPTTHEASSASKYHGFTLTMYQAYPKSFGGPRSEEYNYLTCGRKLADGSCYAPR